MSMNILKQSKRLLIFTLIAALFTTNISVFADETKDITQKIEDHQISLFDDYKIDFVEDDYKDAHLKISLFWRIDETIIKEIHSGSYYEVKLPKELINVSLENDESNLEIEGSTLRLYFNDSSMSHSGEITINAYLSDEFFDQDNLILDLSSISKEFEPFRINLPTVDDLDNSHLDLPVKISRFDLQTENEKTKYYAGEELLMYIGMSLGKDSGTMENTTLEITIPKEYVDVTSFVISDMNNQHEKEIVVEKESIIVRYWNFSVASGVSMDLPFKFKTLNGASPDKHALVIQASLKNNLDQKVLSQTTETLTLQTQTLSLTSRINNNMNDRESFGGSESPIKAGYLSSNLDELSDIKYTYQLLPTQAHSWGNREFKKFVIEYTLPEGAFFSSEANPNWNYDEDTRKATYIEEPSSPILMGAKSKSSKEALNLKFPDGKIDEIYEGSLTVTAYPNNPGVHENSIVWNSKTSFKLKADRVVVEDPITFYKYGAGTYFDTLQSKEKQSQWRIRINNNRVSNTSGSLNQVVIKDHNLDSNLKYTGLQFDRNAMQGFQGSLNIDVVLVDGTKKRIETAWRPQNKDVVLFNSKEVVAVEVSFTEGSYLESGKYMEFYVLTDFKNTKNNLLQDGESRRSLSNYASLSGQMSDGSAVSKSNSDILTLMKVNPGLGVQKQVVGMQTSYFINDTVSYKLNVKGIMLDNQQSLNDLKVIDFIPQGMSYVKDSAAVKVFNNVKNESVIANEPTVVYNYKNSGKTALIWDLKTLTHTGILSTSLSNLAEINYQLEIGQMTNMGENVNEAYLVWNNPHIQPYQSTSNNMFVEEDIYKLNENDTDEISKSQQTIRYVATREVILTQRVRGNLDQNYLLPPGETRTEYGKDISYLLSVFNNSTDALDDFTLLKVFPTKGQLSINEALIDRSMDPETFNSEMTLRLTGPVSVPDAFRVLYTVDDYRGDEAQFIKDATWQSSLEQYSKATAIKIELKESVTLKKTEKIDFEVKLKTYEDFEEGSRALSSFAIATTSDLDFLESNISEVRYVKYQVSGKAFDDLNGNGLFDVEDKPFGNVKVKLVDDKFNTLTDPWGHKYETTTSSFGDYSMSVYREGDYRVVFETPSGYRVSSKHDLGNGSNIDETGKSDKFRLHDDDKYVVVNGGYYGEKHDDQASLVIENKLKDSNQQEYQNDDQFIFKIMVNGKPYIGDYNKIDERHSNSLNHEYTNSGFLFFNSNERIEITGLTKGSHYQVEVLENDRYIPTPSSRIIEGTLLKNQNNVTFNHTLHDMKTSYTVHKEWQGGPSVRPDIRVQLYQDDRAYGEAVTMSSGTLTYRWDNLPYKDELGRVYRYSVDELDVPQQYEKVVKDNVITNTFVSETINYKAKTIWINSPQDKPTVELQLMQNDKPYGKAVSLPQGTNFYQWEAIPKYDKNGMMYKYNVVQITNLSDYKTSVSENTIMNTYMSKMTSYTVYSQWEKGFRLKPDIEVQLLQNDEPYGTSVWMQAGLTHYTWNHLPVVDKQNVKYEYRIEVLSYLPQYQRTIKDNIVNHKYILFDIDVSTMSEEALLAWLNGNEFSVNKPVDETPFDPRNPQNPYVLGAHKNPLISGSDILPNTGEASRIRSIGFELTLIGFVLYILTKKKSRRE